MTTSLNIHKQDLHKTCLYCASTIKHKLTYKQKKTPKINKIQIMDML